MAFKDMNIQDFVALLGSDAPAPGGGAGAGLGAALGIALSEMVCSLTINSKKYEGEWAFAKEAKEKCRELETAFLAAMDEDAAAYSKVSAAYKLPKDTEDDKTARSAAIQESLLICVQPPMKLMELGLSALELTDSLLGHTTVMAVSDIGVAALELGAAVRSAWLNVLINIGSIKDKMVAEEYRGKGEKILYASQKLSEEIYKDVIKHLV